MIDKWFYFSFSNTFAVEAGAVAIFSAVTVVVSKPGIRAIYTTKNGSLLISVLDSFSCECCP